MKSSFLKSIFPPSFRRKPESSPDFDCVGLDSGFRWNDGVSAWLLGLTLLAQLIVIRGADIDLWGRLAMGALVWAGKFPYRDDFSYLANGQPWIDHEWLSGVIFLPILQMFGDVGLLVLKVLLLSVIVLTWTTNQPKIKTRSVWVWSGCLMYILFAFIDTIRAQVFGITCFSVWLWALERRQLKWLPLVMLLWVNTHGSWIIGAIVFAVYALFHAREDLKRWLATGLFCVLAICCTPYGPETYLRHMLASYQWDRSGIVEWSPVPMWSSLTAFWPLKLMLVILLASIRRVDVSVIVILLLLWQGLLHQKLLAFALVAMGFYGPLWLARWQFKIPQWITVVLSLILFLQTPFTAVADSLRNGWSSGPHAAYDATWQATEIPPYPLGAVKFLEQAHSTGKIWVPFEWGEFVMWQLYPKLRVSIDARYEEVYQQSDFQLHQQFKDSQFDPADLFYPMRPDWLLISRLPNGKSMGVQKLSQKYWRLVYRDDVSLLLQSTKRSPIRMKAPNKEALPLKDFIGDLRRFDRYPLQ